jgi:hypothetical protein
MKKTLFGSMAVLAVLLFFGCGSGPKDNGYTTVATNSPGFWDNQSGGTLTINNQASFDVIIFGGKVTNDLVLGGIRSGKSKTFDLKKINLPSDKGSFLIRAASISTYDKKNARISEADVMYSALVVYDLTDPADRTEINIFAGIDETQSTYIYASNQSQFVLELRLGTPTGEKIATLAPIQENKKIYLTPAADGLAYNFYATYVYIDPATNEMKSFVAGDRKERQRDLPASDGVTPIIFTGPKDTSQIGYIVGFLQLKNDTGQGLVFQDGRTLLPDQKGRRFVRSGQLQTFEIPSTSGNAGQTYTNLNMEFDDTSILRINNISIKPGTVYDVLVSQQNGNFAYDVRETAAKNKLEDMRMSLFLGD